MTWIYALPDATPHHTESGPPTLLQVWLGNIAGELFGVLTDPLVSRTSAPPNENTTQIRYMTEIQAFLFNSTISEISGIGISDVIAVTSEELPRETFAPAIIQLDGQQIAADSLTYHGLDFLLARAYREYPLGLVRTHGSLTWPRVTSRPIG